MIDRREFQKILQECAETLAQIECVRTFAPALESLAGHVLAPFTIAIGGRMKSGKSTLLNALVGKPVAVCDVEEATATINFLQYGEGASVDSFEVHWKDGRTEMFPLAQIRDWVGKSHDVVRRVAAASHLCFYAPIEQLRHFQIVDTPGTGSVEKSHEEASKGFLDPHALQEIFARHGQPDAIIYVVSVVGRNSDLDLLKDFGSGRLPGSDAYNSVCVVHKWDGIEDADPCVSAVHKADKLHLQLEGSVASTIAVSAPLALAAVDAPDTFFDGIITFLHTADPQELERVTRTHDRWIRDPVRAELLASCPSLPWVSFRLILTILRQHQNTDTGTARRIVREASGIDALRRLIETQFFHRAETIKLCQLLGHANRFLEPASILLTRYAETLHESEEKSRYIGLVTSFQRRIREYSQQIEALHLDLQVLEFLTSSACELSEVDRAFACTALEGGVLSNLAAQIDHFRVLLVDADSPKQERLLAHILQRLEERF